MIKLDNVTYEIGKILLINANKKSVTSLSHHRYQRYTNRSVESYLRFCATGFILTCMIILYILLIKNGMYTRFSILIITSAAGAIFSHLLPASSNVKFFFSIIQILFHFSLVHPLSLSFSLSLYPLPPLAPGVISAISHQRGGW